MALLHVAVTGRDRRHLSELRNKFRVVVVGARETRRGIVVDNYIPADRVDWLRKKGYGVELLEDVEAPGRARQAEGRAAVETRLKRGRTATSSGAAVISPSTRSKPRWCW